MDEHRYACMVVISIAARNAVVPKYFHMAAKRIVAETAEAPKSVFTIAVGVTAGCVVGRKYVHMAD